MKTMILLVVFAVASIATVFGQTYVNGYFKSNGTYVQPHIRSSANSTNLDNWSTRGNFNPYTGTAGSVARDYSQRALNYGAGHVINTGPCGGQYYINNNYTKVYVPKQPVYSAPSYAVPRTYTMPSSINVNRIAPVIRYNGF